MPDLSSLSLKETIHSLRAGDFSSHELTQYYLNRIEHFEPILHTFLYLAPEQALKKADLADNLLLAWRKNRDTNLPALTGTPLAVKDVLCVANMPCTCGSLILKGFIPPFNATVVERLLAAGVIIVGKTNTDEFAMGSSTENSAYGPTLNPWNTSCVPGGSSGGSAAAVSARLVPVALGTDTGGSVRQPASFCGITGLKPTYGRVSRYGLIAFGSSLDVAGILGRTAEDITLIFRLMAGKDPRDATSIDLPVPDLQLEKPFSIKNLRVGVPKEYFVAGVQPDVQDRIHQAIKLMESMGAKTYSISLPHTEYALPVYYLIAPAEASANLARYDGLRYGPRTAAETIWDVLSHTRGDKFGTEVKRRIMLGTYALSAGYYEAYYGKAQKVRTLIKKDFELAFKEVDLIAAPVAPTTAFRLGEHHDNPLAMYLEDVYTLPANLAGIPALAFPVGISQHNLPIGMQLMSPLFREEILLKVAHRYQLETNWHNLKPKIS